MCITSDKMYVTFSNQKTFGRYNSGRHGIIPILQLSDVMRRFDLFTVVENAKMFSASTYTSVCTKLIFFLKESSVVLRLIYSIVTEFIKDMAKMLYKLPKYFILLRLGKWNTAFNMHPMDIDWSYPLTPVIPLSWITSIVTRFFCFHEGWHIIRVKNLNVVVGQLFTNTTW